MIRNSVLTVDCLGPEEQRGVIYVRGDAEESTTTMTEKRKLRVGDIQSMVFEAGDDPPWYQPNAPRDDIPESAMSQDDIEKCRARIMKEKAAWEKKNKLYEAKGRINPFPPPDDTIMIPGFIGKAKGIKQILFERGLWKAGMVRSKTPAEIKQLMLLRLEPPSNDMCYDKVLSACTDFALEKTALEEMIESRGHILIYSVACHPELAGVGVEYC